MNTEAMTEWLAIEVLKWGKIPYSPIHDGFHYDTPEGKVYYDDFDPFNNLDDAFRVLDTWETYGISKGMLDSGYYVSIYPDFEKYPEAEFEGEADTLPTAICIAACRASGYIE